MTSLHRRVVVSVAALLAIGLLGPGLAAAPSPDAQAWWSHVELLAADSLRGRLTGTEDYLKAAHYVAAQYQEYGAQPGGTVRNAAGTAAYFQDVPLVWRQVREPECSVTITRNSVSLPFTLGEDGYLPATVAFAESLDAPLVFVGYGLSVPEAGYSDLEGIDLRGKIAVYFRSGPDTLPPNVRAHAQATDVRWSGLRAAGAVGYMAINPMGRGGRGWRMASQNRHQPGFALDDAGLESLSGARFSMRLNPAYLDSLLLGSGHSAEELFDLSVAGARLPVFPLPVRLNARVRFDERRITSPNVVGIIPGSDPKLRDEYVVLSAHLDHLGVGEPVNGDSIFNGAMDNAAGVASLIEIARYAKAAKSPFRRSVILLAVTGEEQNLFGSWWFAARPTLEQGRIVADINLDMFLPIMPLHTITVYGRTESDLGERFATVAEKAGIAVEDDPAPRRNYFIRSDQYSFIRRGVPSLFFELGAGADTAAAGKLATWNRTRYHRVSDDLDQPVDLDAAVGFTRLLYDYTRDVANAEAAPQWAPGSFFRRFVTGDQVRGGGAKRRAK